MITYKIQIIFFGAIARSAAAFNFEVIAIPLKRSVKITERTFSIASGGLEKVEILFYNSIFSLIKKFNSILNKMTVDRRNGNK